MPGKATRAGGGLGRPETGRSEERNLGVWPSRGGSAEGGFVKGGDGEEAPSPCLLCLVLQREAAALVAGLGEVQGGGCPRAA